MDKDLLIMRNILRDAKKKMLSRRKWKKYACMSEEEMQTYLEVLLGFEYIAKKERPSTAATDGHGRKLISWGNEPEYSITRAGEEYLNKLENPQ